MVSKLFTTSYNGYRVTLIADKVQGTVFRISEGKLPVLFFFHNLGLTLFIFFLSGSDLIIDFATFLTKCPEV